MSYVGPGDVISGAAAWWGLRGYNAAVSNGTTKAIRLVRDSDNAQQDFVILSSGDLDLASIITFKGSANLFVTTFYDQTGNGFHLNGPGGGNNPAFLLNQLGGHPAVALSGSMYMASASAYTRAQPLTISAVANRVANYNQYGMTLIPNGGTPQFTYYNQHNTFGLYGGTSYFTTPIYDGFWHSIQAVYNNAASASFIVIDGVSTPAIGAWGTDGWVSNTFEIGWHGGGLSNSILVEEGLWPLAFNSTQAGSLNTNQLTYWGLPLPQTTGWVQSTNSIDLSDDVPSSTAVTVTMKNGAVATGNAVLLVFGASQPVSGSATVTDNATGFTNTYTVYPFVLDSSSLESTGCAVGLNIQGHPTQFTVNFPGGSATLIAFAEEYHGYASIAGHSSATSSASGGSQPFFTGTITTTQPALIWGASWTSDLQGASPGPGFTARTPNKGGAVATEDLMQTAAGSAQVTFIMGSSNSHGAAHMIALYPAVTPITLPAAAGSYAQTGVAAPFAFTLTAEGAL